MLIEAIIEIELEDEEVDDAESDIQQAVQNRLGKSGATVLEAVSIDA